MGEALRWLIQCVWLLHKHSIYPFLEGIHTRLVKGNETSCHWNGADAPNYPNCQPISMEESSTKTAWCWLAHIMILGNISANQPESGNGATSPRHTLHTATLCKPVHKMLGDELWLSGPRGTPHCCSLVKQMSQEYFWVQGTVQSSASSMLLQSKKQFHVLYLTNCYTSFYQGG